MIKKVYQVILSLTLMVSLPCIGMEQKSEGTEQDDTKSWKGHPQLKIVQPSHVPFAFAQKKQCTYPAVCFLYQRILKENENFSFLAASDDHSEILDARERISSPVRSIIAKAAKEQQDQIFVDKDGNKIAWPLISESGLVSVGLPNRSPEYNALVTKLKSPENHAIIMNSNPTEKELEQLQINLNLKLKN
ncbi:MAG: hypothetical protein ACXWL2_01745 [Candidatus Chromulinivorax sp.]